MYACRERGRQSIGQTHAHTHTAGLRHLSTLPCTPVDRRTGTRTQAGRDVLEERLGLVARHHPRQRPPRLLRGLGEGRRRGRRRRVQGAADPIGQIGPVHPVDQGRWGLSMVLGVERRCVCGA